MSRPITMVCRECGSEDVLKDAWAEWDINAQEWVLQNVFDNAYCEKCEGECKIDEVVIEHELPELTEVTIHPGEPVNITSFKTYLADETPFTCGGQGSIDHMPEDGSDG